jgi:hypothetical protein
MNINLTSTRRNNIDTIVSIEFIDITADDFRLIGKDSVKNSKGEAGVIFHIQNDKETRMEASGNETISFTEDFTIENEKARVFYWNDSDLLANNLDCFRDFLEINGLDKNAKIGDFICSHSSNKSIAIPRQAGNGGVLEITAIP